MIQFIFLRLRGKYEMAKKDALVEQIIRPTGLVDPEISIRKKNIKLIICLKKFESAF